MKKSHLITIIVIGVVMVVAAIVITKMGKRGRTDLTKDFSYALGTQYAQNVKRQGVEIDRKEFVAGALDVFEGKTLRLSDGEMQEVMQDWQHDFDQKIQNKAKENATAGEDFLKKYEAQEGVKKTSSGLMYKVLSEGSGTSPKPTDLVTVQYSGKLIDGTEFDSSAKLAAAPTMAVKTLIPGWVEALQLMKPGSKFEIVVPAKLGYGDQMHPKIPPGSTLIFEIELISHKPPPAAK